MPFYVLIDDDHLQLGYSAPNDDAAIARAELMLAEETLAYPVQLRTHQDVTLAEWDPMDWAS